MGGSHVQNPAPGLVDAIRSGDVEPWSAQMEALRRQLYWTALAIVGNPEDANDVVAETLFKVWRNIRSLRRTELFSGWCRQILINECRRLWRKEQRTVSVDWESMVADEEDRSQDQILALGTLQAMITNLNAGERAVVVLRYMHDQSLEDIAESLDIPIGTVKSRLARAHAHLRQQTTREGVVGHA
jgi:RNA polymerase sigma-70 factor (ECF subfamily)